MALAEQAKKGGRYTKKEQEERKLQVYHLHFEEEKSAVEIAKMLNVNRNTINDDIHYWYQRIGNETNITDITTKLARQILLLHIQRDRMLDYLEDAESVPEKIKIERFIFDIDNKLTSIYSKMLDNKQEFPVSIKIKDVDEDTYDDINENVVKEFVKYLISSYKKSDPDIIYSEDELRFNFMNKNKCDYEYASRVIEKMKHDGLIHCNNPLHDPMGITITCPGDTSMRYMIAKFAKLRGYAKLQV